MTCETFDAVRLNFSEGSLDVLELTLLVIMFGVALEIRTEDFRRLLREPKPALTGLISQLVLLPAFTLGLVWLLSITPLRPCPSMALGMFLVAACPGGNVSNFMSMRAKGNVALSVSLSAASTLLAIFMTPFNFAFWAQFYPDAKAMLQTIEVDVLGVFKSIFLILGLPLTLGMLTASRFPETARKLSPIIQRISMLIFFGYIVAAVAGNFDFITQYIQYVFLLVLLHNALGFGGGYAFSALLGNTRRDRRTISIETGIQNTGLGLVLIFGQFGGLGGMAMMAALYGIWHLITGLGISLYWSRINPDVS